MSIIVSEFTTQLTAGTSISGIIAIGLLIAGLLEVEMIRAHDPSKVKESRKVLQIALVPLSLVFLTWMAARLFDLIN